MVLSTDDGRIAASPLYVIAGGVSIVVSLLIIGYAFESTFMPRRRFANIVLGGCVLVYYFEKAHTLGEEESPLTALQWGKVGFFVVAGVAGLLAGTYVHLSYERWIDQAVLMQYTTLDLVVGATIMFLVTDMTFRSFGKALGGAIVLALVYGWLGAALPGFLQHSGLSLPDLIARQTVVLDGVYGTLLQIAATWVGIFIVFAGFVQAQGGFEFIYRIGRRVAVRSRSGVAQSAVVASMFVGMLTGGAAVNVALSGSFTIPLMIENRVPPRIAGAIESMASTGGQILPPIMGLAAFLIADFIGVSYGDVVVAALLPALFFYLTVAIAVHVLVLSSGWDPEITFDDIRAEEGDDLRSGVSLTVEGLQYLLPLGVLLYLLVFVRWPIMLSGGYTIGTFILLRLLYVLSPFSPDDVSLRRVAEFGRNSIEGLRQGASNLAPFLGLLAALGMLTTTLSFSGLGLRLSTLIIVAGGESFIAILLIAMVISLLFGLGMPTPAAYILVATVLAPALVQIGLAQMTAHLFVFYFALLSSITPPVAIACAVASEIADADFLETVRATLIIGGPVFAIPYLFVAHPSIIEWGFPEVGVNAVLLLIGIVGFIFALTGSNGNNEYLRLERVLLLVLFAIVGFYPGTTVRALAAVGVLVIGVRGSGLVDSLRNLALTHR